MFIEIIVVIFVITIVAAISDSGGNLKGELRGVSVVSDKNKSIKPNARVFTNEAPNGANSKIQKENHDFKMAFILLVKSPKDATETRLKKLNKVRSDFHDAFAFATDGLASMDTSAEIAIIEQEQQMIDPVENPVSEIVAKEVVKKFYKTNHDDFDFITIYSTFQPSNGMPYQHQIIYNNIIGLGDYTSLTNDRDEIDSARLLGINVMRNIDMLSDEDDYSTMRSLLHETGHQWCCYAGNNFNEGANNETLEIIQQNIHFYRGLESKWQGGDPMDSDYWLPNGDGTYIRSNNWGVMQKYHPFALYFMGILPVDRYGEKFMIYNAGIVGQDFEETTAVPYKTVTVNEIIKFAGPRKFVDLQSSAPSSPSNLHLTK